MAKSPIRLNSSSKAKLRATQSPSNHHEQSQLLPDESHLRSSVHTISVKQSPHRHKQLQSNFTPEAINYAKSQPYNNVTFRSGSPPTMRESPNRNLEFSQQLQGSKSFHQMISSQRPSLILNHPSVSRQIMVSPPKSVLYDSIARPESFLHIMSPAKSNLENDRSFIKVELGKRKASNQKVTPGPESNSPSNQIKIPANGIITIRPRMMSPPGVVDSIKRVQLKQPHLIQQVHSQVSGREIELQRKVKILEMRISELYGQKNQMQTQMNEANIRLQYENNFLKEKLDAFTSKQKQTFTSQQRQHSNEKQTLSQQASERLIKELEKSQENEYHQSKQIHNLKQHLLETEEMLSKEISKSLSLLEELQDKENENEDLKDDLKKLKEQLLHAEEQLNQSKMPKLNDQSKRIGQMEQVLSELKQKLEESECDKINLELQVRQLQASLEGALKQNSCLEQQLEELKKNDYETKVTRDLMNDLEQNNELLITAIRTLEASLRQSESLAAQLQDQKEKLEYELHQLKYQIENNQSHIDSDYQNQLQALTSNLQQIQAQLQQKNSQIDHLSGTIREQETEIQEQSCQMREQCSQLKENEAVIRNKEARIEELMKSQEEGNSSTANSFYKKMGDPCGKCDELRKTIIKLNSHLTKSSSSIISSLK